MTDQNSQPQTYSAWAVGWTAFASVVMTMIGVFQVFTGLTAIVNDEFRRFGLLPGLSDVTINVYEQIAGPPFVDALRKSIYTQVYFAACGGGHG